MKILCKENWLRLFAIVASFQAHPASLLDHSSKIFRQFARKKHGVPIGSAHGYQYFSIDPVVRQIVDKGSDSHAIADQANW